MMKFKIITKEKTNSKTSSILHLVLTLMLPLIVFLFVSRELTFLGISVVLFSKWRMFAVKSRHWIANIRANAVDIFFNISVILLMYGSNTLGAKAIWLGVMLFWVMYLKPKSGTFMVMLQAYITQILGIIAILKTMTSLKLLDQIDPFVNLLYGNQFLILLIVWMLAYSCARHFIGTTEEKYANVYAHIWALFNLQIFWSLSHWLISYWFLPQISLIILILATGLLVMGYSNKNGKLTNAWRSQTVSVISLLLGIIFVSVYIQKLPNS